MQLLNPSDAQDFLSQYKRLLCEVAGKELDGIEDFGEARSILYKDDLHKSIELGSNYSDEFVYAVRNALFGKYIYGKKYRQGFAFKFETDEWFCAAMPTTPMDEMLPDWIMIETALLPIYGLWLCDGLVIGYNTSIGSNMVHSMIQELKIERKKWSSANRLTP